MKRKTISKIVRFEIFKRDGFTCQYCGATPPGVLLEIDHIKAVSLGGENGDENLITACFDCNRGKAARDLTSVPKSLKDRASEVSEREDQIRGFHNVLEAKRNRLEDEMWKIASALEGVPVKEFRRSELHSIKLFLDRLPFHEVLESAETAIAKFPYSSKKFRYFCGICWSKIRGPKNG